jgi:ATP-dependent Clp protease protease subunit
MKKTNERSGDLDDNRIIYVKGAFNEEMAQNIFEKLISLELKDPNKDILMIIDSYGGYCHSYTAIHDLIKLSRCDVATLCVGKAMSCGQLLLMSGTKGKRFATENARVLVHELSAGAWGKLTDLEIDINEHREMQKILEKLIKKYSGLKKKKIQELMSRDSFMSVKEAKELGIIDHVVKTHKDLYKRINI